MKTIAAFSLTCIISLFPAFAGPTIDMTGSRTVRISGEVGGSILSVASNIERLSAASSEPINIIINSPGGSVPAGLQLVEALHIAKARGVTVRCAVTNLAASMAFIILSECSERYALSNSLLLFHPARAMLMFATLKAEDARYMAEELEAINFEMCDRLELSMGIASAKHKEWFSYHYKNETLWTATRLVKQIPQRNWITIVSDIKTDKALFGGLNSDGSDEASISVFLQSRSTKQ